MAETTFTFRVEYALKGAFVAAAKAHDRPASVLLRDFMRDYVRRSAAAAESEAPPARAARGFGESGAAGTAGLDPKALFPDREALAALCRRRGIRRLSLFGSRLKGTARPDSDVDLLVAFEPGATPGLLGMAEIELELSGLSGGRRVDLRTKGDLSRFFRDDVAREAIAIYVSG